jgi:hypothetical protein
MSGIRRSKKHYKLFMRVPNEKIVDGDVKGVEELDAALAKFWQANEKFRVFYPDYTTAILIEDEIAEYLRDIDHD